MRTRPLVLTALAALFVAAPALAGVPIAPVAILTGPENQYGVHGNGTHVGWTSNTQNAPNRYHAFASADGGVTRFRLDGPGNTRGYFGDLSDDGLGPPVQPQTALFQQVTFGPTQSDLYWYDLVGRTPTRAAEIDTNQWEWAGRFSDAFILFLRDNLNQGRSRLVLFDRTGTDPPLTLADVPFGGPLVLPGDVGDRYATWTTCTVRACNAMIYDTAGPTRRRITLPANRDQYAPVVDELNGVVYWVRSKHACGATVRILSAPVAGPFDAPTVVATLPAGVDTDLAMSLRYTGATTGDPIDLLFTRWRCGPAQGDLFQLPGVATHP
jgi:hypothetical protein